MKNIAIVTGASSGMGRDFVRTLSDNITVDEMWVIARRKDRLLALKEEISIPIKAIDLDLSKDESIKKLEKLLKEEKVNVKILINASGYGKFDSVSKLSYEDNVGMIDLNISAVTKMCIICIPFMKEGSKIINIASLAAYQPTPYMNIYAASKSYVLHFSRALNRELKKKGIHVMALCPYWTKTEFFDVAKTKSGLINDYIVMYNSIDVVNSAWKALKKNKDVCLHGFVSKFQVLFCKLMPHRVIMNIWLKQQKLK